MGISGIERLPGISTPQLWTACLVNWIQLDQLVRGRYATPSSCRTITAEHGSALRPLLITTVMLHSMLRVPIMRVHCSIGKTSGDNPDPIASRWNPRRAANSLHRAPDVGLRIYWDFHPVVSKVYLEHYNIALF